MKVPMSDGEVTAYQEEGGFSATPRIYYVNGIQTTGSSHATTARVLSILTEHTIIGVYNKTAGMVVGLPGDLLHCLADWADGVKGKLMEKADPILNSALNGVKGFFHKRLGIGGGDPIDLAHSLRGMVPPHVRVALIENYLATSNRATASLFAELSRNLGGPQWIVAHSQGNLITANALWAMVIAHGESSLENMKVYSLASPSPAWPMGIRGGRRKVYGHEDDVVTFADPHNWTFITRRIADGKYGRTAGDWRMFGQVGIGGHDIKLNMLLNFAYRIRSDLGLPLFDGVLPTVQ